MVRTRQGLDGRVTRGLHNVLKLAQLLLEADIGKCTEALALHQAKGLAGYKAVSN